jgi:hypothetical protein
LNLQITAALLMLTTAAPLLAAEPTLRGIAVDATLDADRSPNDPLSLTPPPSIVRLRIVDAIRSDQTSALERIERRLAAFQAKNIQVILALGELPAGDADVEPWRAGIRAIADRGRGKVVAYQVGDASHGALPDLARYGYLLRLASVQLRSVDPAALVFEGPLTLDAPEAVDWERSLLTSGLSAYIDGVALAAPETGLPTETTGRQTDTTGALDRMLATIEREAPSAIAVLGPIALPDSASSSSTANSAVLRLLDTHLRFLGTKVRVTSYTGTTRSLQTALTAAARFSDLFSGEVVTLDERAAELTIKDGPTDVTATTPHRLLYSLSSLDTYVVIRQSSQASPAPAPPGSSASPARRSGSTLDVEITVANASAPTVRDPMTGSAQPVARLQSDSNTKKLRFAVPRLDHPLIVDLSYGSTGAYTLTTETTKEALPRVEEIISRQQQVQAAQDAVLRNYVAHVRIEQHFHPSPADPAYNIVTENRLFSDRGGTEWEELSFELNGAKWTGARPSFPLIQPEKVLSLPLDLRLNQDYDYRLEGVEAIAGREAFVVRFEPADPSRALYRGTVWIDRKTYARVKVQAVETKLRGPVVSNDETQLFEPSGEIEGRPIWLLNHLASKQVFLVAGRTMLVEREVRLSTFSLNSTEFEASRSAARDSTRIMYRDTDEGVRYFVKKGETRVVSQQMTTSARAFALGTDIDPSLDFPLPIGGLDILDFNFLNRDMQLALLYGGVIALGNIQHANLWGGKFDASLDFFGLALKSNDDLFDGQGKVAGERVNRIPASTGLNIGYQVTPFQKVIGRYQLRYDAYFKDPKETSTDFVIPSNTLTNGEGVGYEYRRRGYSLLANATAYQRVKWTPWGPSSAALGFDAADRTYTQYDLGLSKDFVFRTFHTIHLNATYFGGQRLDRFSMYQFGLFDPTRMHGVPTAVRFGELAMVRGSYSFNLFDQYRVDLFLDHANGRDPQLDSVWRQVTGTGVRLNFRAPHSTILQLDFGKSFLPSVYQGAGSTVVQILLLKPL